MQNTWLPPLLWQEDEARWAQAEWLAAKTSWFLLLMLEGEQDLQMFKAGDAESPEILGSVIAIQRAMSRVSIFATFCNSGCSTRKAPG